MKKNKDCKVVILGDTGNLIFIFDINVINFKGGIKMA